MDKDRSFNEFYFKISIMYMKCISFGYEGFHKILQVKYHD